MLPDPEWTAGVFPRLYLNSATIKKFVADGIIREVSGAYFYGAMEVRPVEYITEKEDTNNGR